MDILAIVKDNLPDGVEVPEKALKAIEKEIKQQQALEFVPKDQYSKKTNKIDELEKELKELQGKAVDGDTYKEKFAALEEEYNSYKSASKKEFDDFKSSVETEKAITAKRTAARKALKDLGANDEDLDTFLLDKVDYDKVELDGDKVKDAKVFEVYKEQYKRYFGDTVTVGANPATPPKSDGGKPDYKAQLEAARKSGNTQDAVKIKTEAAKEGVILI